MINRNKPSNMYWKIILLLFLVSCSTNKETQVNSDLKICLTDADIDLLSKSKEYKKNTVLSVVPVQFNFDLCVGLFRYEYSNIVSSVGINDNYALKSEENLYFKTKSKDKNEKKFNEFYASCVNDFSEKEWDYIKSIFISENVTRGKVDVYSE